MTNPSPPRRAFGADVALLTLARLATVAAFFGVNVIGARALEPAVLGSAAVGQTVGMVGALIANAGVNISTIFFLRQRPDERATLVGQLVAVAIGAALLAIALIGAGGPLLFGRVIEPAAWPLVWSAAMMGAAMIGFEFAGALLLGLGRNRGFIAIELMRGIGSLAAVAALLLWALPTDAGFVVGLATGYGLAAALGLLRVRTSGLSLRPGYDRNVTREALGFGLRGQAGNVVAFLGVRLDLLLVPALLDLRAAGIYYIAVRTSEVVGQVGTAAASLVFPRVAADGRGGPTLLTERTTRLTAIVVTVAALVVAIGGEPILRLAFGEAYVAGTSALSILLLAVLPLSIGRILSADLKGRGHPGWASWGMVVSVLATIALDMALIPIWGIEGAAIASVCSYAAGTVALMLFYRRISGGRLAALIPVPGDIGDLVRIVRDRGRAGSASA